MARVSFSLGFDISDETFLILLLLFLNESVVQRIGDPTKNVIIGFGYCLRCKHSCVWIVVCCFGLLGCCVAKMSLFFVAPESICSMIPMLRLCEKSLDPIFVFLFITCLLLQVSLTFVCRSCLLARVSSGSSLVFSSFFVHVPPT